MTTLSQLESERRDLLQRITALETAKGERERERRVQQQYARAMTVANEEDRLQEVQVYMRDRGLVGLAGWEQALEETGITFSVGSTFYCNGKVGGERHDYIRDDDASVDEMLQWLRAEGASEEQCVHFKKLCAAGFDPVRAAAHAHAWQLDSNGMGRRIGRPNPFESKPTTAVTHTGGAGGVDSNFWRSSTADNDYGTIQPGDGRAFKSISAAEAQRPPMGPPIGPPGKVFKGEPGLPEPTRVKIAKSYERQGDDLTEGELEKALEMFRGGRCDYERAVETVLSNRRPVVVGGPANV